MSALHVNRSIIYNSQNVEEIHPLMDDGSRKKYMYTMEYYVC